MGRGFVTEPEQSLLEYLLRRDELLQFQLGDAEQIPGVFVLRLGPARVQASCR